MTGGVDRPGGDRLLGAVERYRRDEIVAARRALGWSQAMLALEADIAISSISRLENGHPACLEVHQKIRAALERAHRTGPAGGRQRASAAPPR